MTQSNDVYTRSLPETDRKRAEDAALEYKLRSESLTRLVANSDFRQWLSFAYVIFEGATHGQHELSQFEQGRRAAFSFLLESLADAQGLPELVGEMVVRHYKSVRLSHENAHKYTHRGEMQ